MYRFWTAHLRLIIVKTEIRQTEAVYASKAQKQRRGVHRKSAFSRQFCERTVREKNFENKSCGKFHCSLTIFR